MELTRKEKEHLIILLDINTVDILKDSKKFRQFSDSQKLEIIKINKEIIEKLS